MAISANPTRTRGIEKAWLREVNRRFREFRQSVISELVSANRVGVITVNAFEIDAEQLRAYMAFFQNEIDQILLGTWQEKYQRRAYQLAIDRAMAALRSQGFSTTLTEIDFIAGAGLGSFTAIPSLGFSAIDLALLPIHRETLEFLFTRSFESLEGLTATMARDVRTILFNGVEQGKGITELIRQIDERIKVGRSRASLIARTETIQAYQRGTINQTQLASEFLDEPIGLRWLTVRDGKVRHLHARWHGTVTDEDTARRRISISPFNCRCGLAPVIKEADTEAKRIKFKNERKQLEALTPA